MKRIRLLVLAGVIAAAVPFGMTAAGATGGTPANSVSIDQNADYDFQGSNIDVKLYVRCSGTTSAQVQLNQAPPQTGSPATIAFGNNPFVVCDGQTHSVGVTLIGAGFDVGWATATARLLGPGGTPVKATSTRSVYLSQV